MDQTDTIKYWIAGDKLKWSDFNGVVPAEQLQSDLNAVCPHEIVISPIRENGVLKYEVRVMFLKNLAWFKDTSSYILAHEQLHFDIAELFARKLRKAVKDYTAKYNDKEFSRTVEELLSEERKAQDDYDRETAHGIYETKQMEWTREIARELKSLVSYSF